MLLSIVVPAYNEEKTIAIIISRVKEVRLSKGIEIEIIAVDDASTDSTFKVLSNIHLKKLKLRIFKHKINRGKGAAVKTGFSKANGDLVMIQDADLEYDPSYIPKLIEPILKGKAKVVYGTRLKNYPLKLSGAKRTPLIAHYLGNKFLSLITNLIYQSGVTDMETGYKVFHKDVIKNLIIESERFDLEPEITAKVLKRGYHIYEIPIKTTPRGYDEGKKITWKDGIRAVFTLIKYRFKD